MQRSSVRHQHEISSACAGFPARGTAPAFPGDGVAGSRVKSRGRSLRFKVGGEPTQRRVAADMSHLHASSWPGAQVHGFGRPRVTTGPNSFCPSGDDGELLVVAFRPRFFRFAPPSA